MARAWGSPFRSPTIFSTPKRRPVSPVRSRAATACATRRHSRPGPAAGEAPRRRAARSRTGGRAGIRCARRAAARHCSLRGRARLCPVSTRERLDNLLVDRGPVASRERARRLIMAGAVRIGDQVVDKPGPLVASDAPIAVTAEDIPYVSRGGLKLAHALDTFATPVAERVVLDVGASTGGFTDCVLQRGARAVIAVEVGYGQFAWSLRQDPRVTLLERTNIRHLDPAALPAQPELAVIDVAFISLRLVLPAVVAALAAPGD